MRHVFFGLVVAGTTALAPFCAMAANQEIAEQIASNLRSGGQLQDYKVGVKYQDGTAWLDGHVTSPQQMAAAVRIAFQTPGVSRVVNNLTVSASEQTPLQSQDSATNGVSQAASAGGSAASLRIPHGTTAAEQLQHSGSGLRSSESQPASIAARLQRVVENGEATPPLEPLGKADQVPSAFAAAGAEPTSAAMPVQMRRGMSRPIPVAYMQQVSPAPLPQGSGGVPMPAYAAPAGGGVAPACYDQPSMPGYSWPSYAAYPNYAAVTYPKQYSPTAWPFIGPFYPYPQVPLGWRKVTLEWDDGWWMLDFKD